MSAILLSLATLFSTLAGGLFTLKFRGQLRFILSFTAGVLLGVVSFDILPEIFETARNNGLDSGGAMIALVAGFLSFHVLEKFLLIHHAHEPDYAAHRHPQVGMASALALIGHSFLDGIGIGLAFQVSNTTGVAVAAAVIAHDFCDGMNTVSLMLANHNPVRRSLRMLALDALAPVLGAASTLVFSVPPAFLLVYLGFFGGFLLYIGTSDVLPEAHSQARFAAAIGQLGLTCLGAAFIYFAIRLAG